MRRFELPRRRTAVRGGSRKTEKRSESDRTWGPPVCAFDLSAGRRRVGRRDVASRHREPPPTGSTCRPTPTTVTRFAFGHTEYCRSPTLHFHDTATRGPTGTFQEFVRSYLRDTLSRIPPAFSAPLARSSKTRIYLSSPYYLC